MYRYLNEDGTQRLELRPEEEVFKPSSLAGYEGAPLTDGHPPEDTPVTSENFRRLEVGTATGPGCRVDGDYVAVPLLWKDKNTIHKIEKLGKRQLSPGYEIDLDETPGVHPKYGRYDAVQRNIRINHVALVDRARGGDRLKIRMDGFDVRVQVDEPHLPTRGATMDEKEQIRLLQARVEELEQAARTRHDEQTSATARADKAEAALQPLRDRIEELEVQIASGATVAETEAIAREKRRADAAELAIREFDETLETKTRDRANLMHKASSVMGQSFRMDDLNERQIHEAVIRRLDTSAKFNGQTDAYVSGMFETLLELRKRTAAAMTRIADDVVPNSPGGSARHDAAEEKARRLKEYRDQWKRPLPNDPRAGSFNNQQTQGRR